MAAYHFSRRVLFLTLISVFPSIFACNANKHQNDRENQSDTVPAAAKRDSIVIELVGADSQTVFDLLQSSHQVTYRSTAAGVFVTAIDSIENGGGAYWIYSVNDSLPQVACDRYITKDGDIVRWHFRKAR
jgi:hypothetical protein